MEVITVFAETELRSPYRHSNPNPLVHYCAATMRVCVLVMLLTCHRATVVAEWDDDYDACPVRSIVADGSCW